MHSELPEQYGRTELVLMVIDPFHFFAYWELTPASVQHTWDVLGAEMEGARAVIRMYDISLIDFNGTNAHHWFDIDIGLEAPGWYFSLWSAGNSYCADLGFAARTGRFHPIVRSNIIHLPRAGVSTHLDEHWMRVPFVRRRKPEPVRPLEYVAEPPVPAALRERRTRALQDSQPGFLPGSLPTSPGPRS